MKFSKRTLAVLALFSALFLLTQWLFIPGTYVRSRLLQALQAPKILLQALRSRQQVVRDLTELARENQSLQAQMTQAESRPEIIVKGKQSYIYARVYSTYPFNNEDKLLINAGTDHGVVVGAVVFAMPGIFLGEIVDAGKTTSEVKTLYDPDFEMPVKIGQGNVDALLVGGHRIQLTLISKKKPAQAGQTVTSAAAQYPHGLTLGIVRDVRDSAGNLFQEATVETPYDISELGAVYVEQLTVNN